MAAAAAGAGRGLFVVPAVTVAGDAVVVGGAAVVVEVVVYLGDLDSSSGSGVDLVHSVHFGILCCQDRFSGPDTLLGLGYPLSGSRTSPVLVLGHDEGHAHHALVLDLAGC